MTAVNVKRAGLIVLFSLLIPIATHAQVPNPDLENRFNRDLTMARDALIQRDFQAAIPVLREGLELAERNQDRTWQAAFHFQLGLALQQRSMEQTTSEDLTEAASHYENYLRFTPASGSALNNLAQIYSRTGRVDEARRLYERAIALNDERRGFYALNYADLLKEQADYRNAARYYRMTLQTHPDHPDARAGLLEVYQQTDQDALISFIWDQIDKGREVWATNSALQALLNLPRGQAASPDMARQKEELLASVVVGMSRSQIGPQTIAEARGKNAQIVEKLESLVNDGDIGEGVTELLLVYDRPALREAGEPSWWADKGNRFEDPEQGWWPRDAFRMLLRSLGDWYNRRDTEDIAEAYYRLAVHLTDETDREPDPQALIKLSDLYFRNGETEKVSRLLNASSLELFYGKQQAYKDSNFKKIYAFHRTLGIMYAMAEIWGDEDTIQSAIGQFERAVEIRRLFNDGFADEDNPPVPLEARVVNTLVEGYRETGQPPRRIVNVQLEYLEEAIDERNASVARELIRSIDSSEMNRGQLRSYQRLRARVADL